MYVNCIKCPKIYEYDGGIQYITNVILHILQLRNNRDVCKHFGYSKLKAID